MVRTPLVGALAAGLLMTGVLVPAAANASTHAVGPTAATTASENASRVTAGSSLGPIPIAQTLLFLPTVLGVGGNRHVSEAVPQHHQGGGFGHLEAAQSRHVIK